MGKETVAATRGDLPQGGKRESPVGRSIEIVTAEICTIRDNVARVFMDGVVQIGRRLEEAKQLVPQGGWTEYLANELGYKPSTAQNYMRIAREFGDGQVGLSGKTPGDVFGELGYAQLLPLLGMPEDEREELAGENDLAQMSSREIAALVRERDDTAEKLKETKAELTAARCERKDAFAAQKQAREEKDAAEGQAAELKKQMQQLAAKADEPRPMSEEELAKVREEVAAEQQAAVEAAEQRAAEAAAKLEKVKNPAAHQVNFLFGELTQMWARLCAALAELEKTDQDAACKMRAAVNKNVEGWL